MRLTNTDCEVSGPLLRRVVNNVNNSLCLKHCRVSDRPSSCLGEVNTCRGLNQQSPAGDDAKSKNAYEG